MGHRTTNLAGISAAMAPPKRGRGEELAKGAAAIKGVRREKVKGDAAGRCGAWHGCASNLL